MFFVLILMIIPALVGIGALFLDFGRVTVKEFLLMELISLVVLSGGVMITRYASMHDTEIWSGRVASKAQERVSCEHSYSCNCSTDSKGNTSCQTCYEHLNDWDWNLYTSNDETITIERIDRQGWRTPPRWAAAKVGDSTAIAHSFQNYIKANPDSVLRLTGVSTGYTVPTYPDEVYDYHYVNRAIGAVQNQKMWEWQVQELNSDLGKLKQVNIIFVFTAADTGFIEALKEQWVGGKKNDIVVIIGSATPPKMDWVNVVSWSDSENLKVELRDEILKIGTTQDRGAILDATRRLVKDEFIRKPMDDFKYLIAGLQPGPVATAVLFTLSIALSIGLFIWLHNEDVFDEYSHF